MTRLKEILTHLRFFVGAFLLSAATTVSAQSSDGTSVVYSRAADRLFARGMGRYENAEFAKARDSFQELSNMRANQRTSAGLLMLSRTQVELEEYDLALESARRVEREYQSSRYTADARLLAGDCYYFMRRYYEAASQYGRILAIPAPLALQASAAERLAGIVKNGSITADALDLIRPQVGEDRLRDALLFGEARWYRRLGWEQQARASARTYLAELPDGIFASLAARSLREAEVIAPRATSTKTRARPYTPEGRVSIPSSIQKLPTGPIVSNGWKPRLGVLLPLSGPDGHYGQELLAGIRLANDEAGFPFDLVEADSGREYPWVEGNTGREQVHIDQSEGSKLLRTVQAARYLVEEQDVIALIGPLFSTACVAAAAVAEEAGVPLIAPLTQQSGLDSLGQFIFQLNIVPGVQGKALAEYTTLVLGLETLAVLAPLTDYGWKFWLAFADAVEDNGGTVVHSDWYVPEETRDFKSQFQAMRQAGFGLMRLTDPAATPAIFDSLSLVVLDTSPESEVTFYELLEAGVEVSPEEQPDSTEIFIDTIDGIAVVVESFEDAKRIAAQLRFHRLQTQVIGNDIWYEPAGIRQMTASDREYVKGCILVSGRRQGAAARDFTDLFRSRFGRDPGYAGFGYDAAALVAAGWREGNDSRDAIRDWLAALTDYDGASGRISFPPGRRANDELNLVKIDSRGRLVPLAVEDLPDITVPEDDLPAVDMMEDLDGTGLEDGLLQIIDQGGAGY